MNAFDQVVRPQESGTGFGEVGALNDVKTALRYSFLVARGNSKRP